MSQTSTRPASQHLVAAKLCLILPEGSFEIHGASVADGPTDRSGDFVINNTVIHYNVVITADNIRKCRVSFCLVKQAVFVYISG